MKVKRHSRKELMWIWNIKIQLHIKRLWCLSTILLLLLHNWIAVTESWNCACCLWPVACGCVSLTGAINNQHGLVNIPSFFYSLFIYQFFIFFTFIYLFFYRETIKIRHIRLYGPFHLIFCMFSVPLWALFNFKLNIYIYIYIYMVMV